MLNEFLLNLPLPLRIIAFFIGIIIWFWFLFIYPKSNKNINGQVNQSVKMNNSNKNIIQNMQNSPYGLQVVNEYVDKDRRIQGEIADKLIDRLKKNLCLITIGVLGLGGEPEILANDFLQIAQQSGCETKGINHGVGFAPFEGIQIRYFSEYAPTTTIAAIAQTLKECGLDFIEYPDSSQVPGSVYIYVGYKPSK